MNGAGVLGYVPGLHHVPNSLPDNPFPSFRVFGNSNLLGLNLRSLGHLLPSLGVEAEPLGLVSCLVESDVGLGSVATATSPREEELPRTCWEGDRE